MSVYEINMLDLNGLKRESEFIDKWILEKYPEDIFGTIRDGVIDFDLYIKAKYRILWILKEPYDSDGGGWHMREAINGNKGSGSISRTWKQMAYTTFGLLNNFCLWEDIPYIEDDGHPEVYNSLKEVAYINIKKAIGGTQSNKYEIERHYIENREIIQRQVNAFKPQIIILGGIFSCGSALNLFLKDFLELDLIEWSPGGTAEYKKVSNHLLINAYHPSWPKSNSVKEKYCNDIIGIVRSVMS